MARPFNLCSCNREYLAKKRADETVPIAIATSKGDERMQVLFRKNLPQDRIDIIVSGLANMDKKARERGWTDRSYVLCAKQSAYDGLNAYVTRTAPEKTERLMARNMKALDDFLVELPTDPALTRFMYTVEYSRRPSSEHPDESELYGECSAALSPADATK